MPASVFDVLHGLAEEAGDALAAVDGIAMATRPSLGSALPATISYAELRDYAERLAGVLAAELQLASAASQPTLATWMARGSSWYLVFWAAVRLRVPLVALSRDLPDKSTEAKRNTEILAEHRPPLLVVDANWSSAGVATATATPRIVLFEELWARTAAVGAAVASELPAPVWSEGPAAEPVLCYCYTGGTTSASRCVRVTHRMVLHELATYPSIARLSREDRVLQQHSFYWGGTLFGVLDVALAFGCAVVFVQAWDAEAVAAAAREHRASCLVVVPSLLAGFTPDDMPDVKLMITWGEALPTHAGLAWARRVQLLDLLTATEYFLSLYANWTAAARLWGGSQAFDRPAFRTVTGCHVRLAPVDDELATGASDTGELLVAGPMVSPGYTDPSLTESSFVGDPDVLVAANGSPGTGPQHWFRTKDCVRREPDGGLTFVARADDLVKVGGAWVDLRDVEQRVAAGPCVLEAHAFQRQVFVTFDTEARRQLPRGAVQELRAALPAGFALFAVHGRLPRNAGTGKVDRRRLQELTAVRCPSTLAEERREAAACRAQRSSLRLWYASIHGSLYLASVLHAAASVSTAGTTPATPAWLWAMAWRSSVEFVTRLICVVYACYSWHLFGSYIWADCVFRHFPGSFYGMVLLLCVLTSLLAQGIWAGVSICICLLSRPRHALAWPLVCLLGCPFWLRDHACPVWAARLGEGCRSACGGLWHSVACGSGLLLECSCCERCIPWFRASQGKLDIVAAPGNKTTKKWYCEACCLRFYESQLCATCKRWTINGGFKVKQSTGLLAGSTNGAGHEDGTCSNCGNLPIQERTCEQQRRRRAPASRTRGPGVDVVRVVALRRWQPTEVTPGGQGEGSPAPGEHSGPAREKSRDWQLIERSSGMSFDSPDDSLLILDSLRRAKILNVLRRSANKRLTRDVWRRAVTLGALLMEIAATREESTPDHAAPPPSGREQYALWGVPWLVPMRWCFVREAPLAEPVLRAALQRLAARHACLSAKLLDSPFLFYSVEQCLSIHDLWRCQGRGWFGGRLDAALRWSLWNCWPRVARHGPCEVPLLVLERAATLGEARQTLQRRRSRLLVTSLEAALVPFGEPGTPQEGCLLELMVSHMYADQFSVAPLLRDLAHFVKTGEGAGLDERPLPPLGDALVLLEGRITRAIAGTPGIVRWPLEDQAAGFRVSASLPADAVAAIRWAAEHLSLPVDILLLAGISIAAAWLDGVRNVSWVVVAQERDGPGEEELVGCFAGGRLLTICTEGLDFVGVALRLHHVIQERLWSQPGPMTLPDSAVVNFVWRDFDEWHGFKPHALSPEERSTPEMSPRLLVLVDEPCQNEWHVLAAFCQARYSEEQCACYLDLFEKCLGSMILAPLAPVWHADGSPGGVDAPAASG